jgi:predicted nucleic acid-binding protein
MTDFLLDTNHAASLVTPNHPVRQQMLSCLQNGDTFAVTVPVVTETLFGLGVLPRAALNLAEWARLRKNMTCHIPNESDAESAATLQCTLRRQGWQLSTVDALIAVTALRYDLTLLTSDEDFLSVPGLQRENWIVPKP